MGWSTRQLAELAGTTVKTVRYYHRVGLLDEPVRAPNGYKQYGVAHLTRLLRVRRLSDLGLPLPKIAALGDVGDHPQQALEVLDAELASTIHRLQQVRAELGLVLQQRLPTDLPPELAQVLTSCSDADRALMVVYGRVLGPSGIAAWRTVLADYRHDPVAVEFDVLPAGATEAIRADLAHRLLPHVRELHARFPEVRTTQQDAPGGSDHVDRVVGEVLDEVFNPAQLDVLGRLRRRLRDEPETDATPTVPPADAAAVGQITPGPA